MPTTVCTAKASYKKAPGLLVLSDSHLEWTQDGKKAPSVRVPYSQAACKSNFVERPKMTYSFKPKSVVLQQGGSSPSKIKIRFGGR
jgi:hypothetical protein